MERQPDAQRDQGQTAYDVDDRPYYPRGLEGKDHGVEQRIGDAKVEIGGDKKRAQEQEGEGDGRYQNIGKDVQRGHDIRDKQGSNGGDRQVFRIG